MEVARLNKELELSTVVSQKGLPKSLEMVLGKALKALKEVFPVSGSHLGVRPAIEIKNIAVEQDAELPSWKYVVVSLELPSWGLSSDDVQRLKETIIERVYSELSPQEATKILLEF